MTVIFETVDGSSKVYVILSFVKAGKKVPDETVKPWRLAFIGLLIEPPSSHAEINIVIIINAIELNFFIQTPVRNF